MLTELGRKAVSCSKANQVVDTKGEGVKLMDSYYCTVKEGDLIRFSYTNWKGFKAIRKAIIKEFFFGATEFHKDYQMLIRAFDLDKLEERVFAVKDIDGIEVISI